MTDSATFTTPEVGNVVLGCGVFLGAFKDLGITGVGGRVAVVPTPLVAVLEVVPNTAVKRSGLGIRHRYSSSRGTPTLTVMAMGRRVNF